MKVLLCGIAKCENNYIREWIEWYKNIGVDHILLYDNNDSDGENFEYVISDYIDSGFVEIIDFRGKKICQKEAYNDCYSKHKSEYDWFLFLDIDELLKIQYQDFDGKIKPFLSQTIFDNYNGVKICWQVMTDNNLLTVDGDYSMYNRFIEVSNRTCFHNCYAKVIVRGNLDIEYNNSVHYPDGIENSICDVCGIKATARNKFRRPMWFKAVILHYRFKTIEEYICNKMQRLYADHDEEYSRNALNLDYFFDINKRTKEKEQFANELIEKYGYCLYNRQWK